MPAKSGNIWSRSRSRMLLETFLLLQTLFKQTCLTACTMISPREPGWVLRPQFWLNWCSQASCSILRFHNSLTRCACFPRIILILPKFWWHKDVQHVKKRPAGRAQPLHAMIGERSFLSYGWLLLTPRLGAQTLSMASPGCLKPISDI